METIYLHLDVVGYRLTNVKELKINHDINTHSRLYLSAILDDEAKLEPIFSTRQGTQIGIVNGNRNQPTIFMGMVQTIQIKHLSGIYHLEILAISNSFMLDVKRMRRSFQDSNMQYRDMIKEIIGVYEGSDFLYRTIDSPLGAFTMQYEETDWEFLKRMASRFNAGLVPDYHFNSPKFTFGIPYGQSRGKLESYNFYVRKNLGDFMVSSQNTNPTLNELDAVVFSVQTDEEFMIGDSVTYQDTVLYVKSIEGQLFEGVLMYTYELSTQNGLTQDRLFNEKITGLSVKGKVLESVADMVMVHLEIDDAQDPGTAWHFPYTTLYAAEGHAGWYCMPEIGDMVFIYFPDREEGNGVSVNSIREMGGVGSPEVKVFRTPNGKELKFSPDEILLTCVDGSIFMRLSESEGIEIISSQPININTKSNKTLEAKKKLNLSAKSEILMTCMGSLIKMDSDVKIMGNEVHIT